VDPIDQPIGKASAPPDLELRFDAEDRADATLVPDGDLIESAPFEEGDDLLTDMGELSDIHLTECEVHPDGGDQSAGPDVIHAADRGKERFIGAYVADKRSPR
jgi:hypothetical protein